MFSCTKKADQSVSTQQANLKSDLINPPVSGLQVISVEKAHENLHDYLNAVKYQEPVKAFTINAEMVKAIQANPSITGIRISLGVYQYAVYGVDRNLNEITRTIYGVTPDGSGLCPTLCDETSRITNQEE
jgi:hypothetical protein